MKIWHVRAAPNPYLVDGVSRTVWLMSVEQARLGHDVSLILDAAPTPEAWAMAGPAGLKLHSVSPDQDYAAQIRELLDTVPPKIVHFHSVFIPRQAALAKMLREMGIPYIVTPHAGLAPQVLARGRLKKAVYSALRERPRLMGAAAIALVTPAEEKAVRSYLPNYTGIIRWMPNPVEFAMLDPHCWHGISDPKRMVFLGRFDVLVKGIDILLEIARRLPDVKVDLYGTEEPKTLNWLMRLKRDLPGNVEFHEPVFGAKKAEILSTASLYIQPSRWEGFPVSVAECLYLGVPSLITETLDLAGLFERHQLGLVLSLRPEVASEQIREALSNSSRLEEWSRRGREFAITHFAPGMVAKNHINLYRQIVEAEGASRRATVQAGGNGHAPSSVDSRVDRGTTAISRRLLSAQLRGAVKQNVSRIVERSSSMRRSAGTGRSIVLCYHSINPQSHDLSLDPALFREQLDTLKAMGFEFQTFGDFVNRVMRWGSPKSDVAVVTFDDGFEDNLTRAVPILSELKVPATFFLTTGLVERDAKVIEGFRRLTKLEAEYLSPRQVLELHSTGFEVGAHTHSHTNLARLPANSARWEILHSKQALEQIIGDSVRSFAYPFGKRHIHYTTQTTDLVRESGYRGAAAVAFRSVTSRVQVKIFEIPRFFITRADTSREFRLKVEGHVDWLGSFQELSPVWLKSLVSPEDQY